MTGARPHTWMPFEPYRPEELPAAAGVYVIFVGKIVVYVGQSTNLRARMEQHDFWPGYGRNTYLPWEKLPNGLEAHGKYMVTRHFAEQLMREARLIRRLRPHFNKMHKGSLAA